MLIQFRVRNFKSFKDDAILDLSASKITEMQETVFDIGNERILPMAAVFGANASGKSNVMEALRFMTTYVLFSFGYGGDGKSDVMHARYTPFLFDSRSRIEESSFEVYFIKPGDAKERTYNYGFSIDGTGVREEWLNVKAKTARKSRNIFYRNTETGELDLDGIPHSSRENIRVALEKETLVVSLGSKLRIGKLKEIRDWFAAIEFADYGNPLENIILSNTIPASFHKDEAMQKRVVAYLSAFDKSIAGFNVKVSGGEGDRRVEINTIHHMDDGSEVMLPFKEESAGTIKMFSLYPAFDAVMHNGGLLVVDELNSRLHPLLVRCFLLAFADPAINRNHAQIIFTSHDVWELSNEILRRDEVWFTEKNYREESSLYSLADFSDVNGDKIRKDENYVKNYLLGKYGAIPSLESFGRLLGDDDGEG